MKLNRQSLILLIALIAVAACPCYGKERKMTVLEKSQVKGRDCGNCSPGKLDCSGNPPDQGGCQGFRGGIAPCVTDVCGGRVYGPTVTNAKCDNSNPNVACSTNTSTQMTGGCKDICGPSPAAICACMLMDNNGDGGFSREYQTCPNQTPNGN